jgi:hypothetical protein
MMPPSRSLLLQPVSDLALNLMRSGMVWSPEAAIRNLLSEGLEEPSALKHHGHHALLQPLPSMTCLTLASLAVTSYYGKGR